MCVSHLLGRRETSARQLQTVMQKPMPHRLYIPDGLSQHRPAPLLVALHGCTQTAEQFAAETDFDEVAARYGAIVVYPEQSKAANCVRCWNWFRAEHQRRERGEPAAILQLVDDLVHRLPIDPERIYLAGFSAGGAMAAIVAEQAPDVFAAVGITGGVALHASGDLRSASAAMAGRRSAPPTGSLLSVIPNPEQYRRMRVMIWTGSEDTTVAPANAALLEEQFAILLGIQSGRVEHDPRNDASVTRWRDAAGRARIERWVVHHMGHAWSGGSATGRFTYPPGPRASELMFAFFTGRQSRRKIDFTELVARVRRRLAHAFDAPPDEELPA